VSRHRLLSRRTEDSERTLGSWLPCRVLTCRPGRISDLLSWDSSRRTDLRALTTRVVSGPCRPCGRRGPAKLGCRDTPPPTSLPSVHSPESSLLPTRFGPEATCLGILFRPRGFAPPRRLPPLGRSRACCIPLPVMGFAAFPALGFPTVQPAVPKDRALSAGVPMHSPRRLSHPSKNSTRLQPHHVTVAVAPLPFPADPSRPLAASPLPETSFGTTRTRVSASRPSSAVESVTPLLPLPAGGRPILPGLCSPSRSFPEAREHPCPLALALHPPRQSEENTMLQELRSAPSRLAPRGPHRLAPRGDRRWGWLHQGRPKTPPVGHLAPDIERSENHPTGKHHRGRSREIPRVEARYARRCNGTGFDADGIPPSVHREPRRARTLPGLTEARIRGADA